MYGIPSDDEIIEYLLQRLNAYEIRTLAPRTTLKDVVIAILKETDNETSQQEPPASV